MTAKPKKRLTLKIVLDTNQLFTESASDLLRRSLRDRIKENTKHADISIEWWLPDVVRHERQFQMQREAFKLIRHIKDTERLLGHSLGITSEILAARVEDAVENQIKELQITALPLKTSQVSWERVIEDAVYRRPPFEEGKTEKGFRDTMIAESFVQLVKDSPSTPASCRVVLLTADGLLADAVQERTASAGNVRILRSEEELQDLINTLAANVEETFVNEVRELAAASFFSSGSEGLFYTERIEVRIKEQFSKELSEVPSWATSRENRKWYIANPQFVEKQRQRITWNTTITIKATAYGTPATTIWESSPILTSPIILPPSQKKLEPSLSISQYLSSEPTWEGITIPSTLGSEIEPPKPPPTQGETTVHVIWSATVTTRKKITRPRVEDITFGETTWNLPTYPTILATDM
jgi:hypothetical protein